MEPTSPIIVALDFDSRRASEEVVDRLGDECRFYKVGLELLTAAGPDLAQHLVAKDKEVFLDLKLFEIPNSVAGPVRAAGALGASMVTVHSMGGTGIMTAAVAAARDFPRLRVLALTVVTSMTSSDLADVGIRPRASATSGAAGGAGRLPWCDRIAAGSRATARRAGPQLPDRHAGGHAAR